MKKTREQRLLEQRVMTALASSSDLGGVPEQRGLIRNVMIYCRGYAGGHPLLCSAKRKMATSPGWRPSYSYARFLKDVIDKISPYTSHTEDETEGTSLD